MNESIFLVAMLVPFVILLVAIGAVLKFVHGFVLSLFGRAPSDEPVRPSTGVGRFLGQVAAKLLYPFEQMLRVTSLVYFMVAVIVVADRLRLWDDGLVDAKAQVTALRTLCQPYGSFEAAVPAATACPTPKPSTMYTVEVADLAVTGADGFDTTTVVSLAEIGRQVGVGDTIVYAHPLGQPQNFRRHLSQTIGSGVGFLLGLAVTLRATAIALARMRRGLSGAKSDDDRSFWEAFWPFGSRSSGTSLDQGPDMPSFGMGAVAARYGFGAARVACPTPRDSQSRSLDRETFGRRKPEDAPIRKG